MAFSDYERFKWESMDHLGHRTGLGGPWYVVKRLTDDRAEQAALVRRLVLELFDEGLIFGTYAINRDAYNLDWHEFAPVSREVIERELDRADVIEREVPDLSGDRALEEDPEEVEWFWIFPTPAGERAELSQPADAFFREYSEEDIERRRGSIPDLDS